MYSVRPKQTTERWSPLFDRLLPEARSQYPTQFQYFSAQKQHF